MSDISIGMKAGHAAHPIQVRPVARIAALEAFHTFATSRVGLPGALVVSPPDVLSILAALTQVLGTAHEPTASKRGGRTMWRTNQDRGSLNTPPYGMSPDYTARRATLRPHGCQLYQAESGRTAFWMLISEIYAASGLGCRC